MWVFITDEVTSGNHYPWIYLGFFWVKHGCLYEYLILSMCKKSLTSNIRKTKAICVPRLYIFYSVITIEIFVTSGFFRIFVLGIFHIQILGFVYVFQTLLSLRKMLFRSFTSMGQRKNSESPWRMELQTFRFRAPMLGIWGSEIPHGDSEFFLFPMLVTGRKTFFSVSLILLGSSFDFEPLLLLKEYLGVRLLQFFLITGDRIKNKEKLADKQFWQQRICNISPNRI